MVCWFCLTAPVFASRFREGFDKIGRNTHQEFENEMRHRDWPHFTHQGKEDHPKSNEEEIKR